MYLYGLYCYVVVTLTAANDVSQGISTAKLLTNMDIVYYYLLLFFICIAYNYSQGLLRDAFMMLSQTKMSSDHA